MVKDKVHAKRYWGQRLTDFKGIVLFLPGLRVKTGLTGAIVPTCVNHTLGTAMSIIPKPKIRAALLSAVSYP